MKNQNIVLYLCVVLVLCTLYAAQPIQPLFMDEFALTNFQSVIFTTVIMFPLGIAPLFYGYALETISTRKILKFSLFFLGVSEILFSFCNSYAFLISIRAVQGFLIPAALTSVVSFMATSSSVANVQKTLGNYVAITIVGGFFGRLLSGVLSEHFGWRPFFFLIGALMICVFFLLFKFDNDAKTGFIKPTKKEVVNVLKSKHNLYIYATIFCVFFVFQAVLNFLPFELKNIDKNFGESKVGMMYAGYIIGLITALNITKIIKFLGNESKTMLVGMAVYIGGLTLFNVGYAEAMFFSMFVFCLGMFTVHSTAAGFVNKLAQKYKSITNGLYMSFYYAGGTLGSFLPGVFYQYFGWHAFLIFLTFMLLISVWLLAQLKKSLN